MVEFIYGTPNNKCSNCRFKSDVYETCTNPVSEFQGHNIDKIPTHKCDGFFSQFDNENVSQTKKDSITASLR